MKDLIDVLINLVLFDRVVDGFEHAERLIDLTSRHPRFGKEVRGQAAGTALLTREVPVEHCNCSGQGKTL